MTRAVLDAVLSALRAEGLTAVAQYPGQALDKKTPMVCVGVRSQTLEPAAFGQYLGRQEVQGAVAERYGVKAEMTVLLDLYLPPARAGECQALFAKIAAALSALPAGVRLRKLTRGELAPDPATQMLRCPCAVDCDAWFTGLREEDGETWLEFQLKGVLSNE